MVTVNLMIELLSVKVNHLGFASSVDSDQTTGQMSRLILVFAGYKAQMVGFITLQHIYCHEGMNPVNFISFNE